MEKNAFNMKVARSKKKKESYFQKSSKKNQFQRIVDAGREMFNSMGSTGFSTRLLAKKLKMSQGNLYNYVKSKRELWISIRREDFMKFKNEMEDIVNKHKGTSISLLEKLMLYFFEFARTERSRFQMMFVIPAPQSKIIGPIERDYTIIDPLDIIRKIVQKAIDAKDIKETNINNLTYYLYAIAYGAAFVERDLMTRNIIMEPINRNANISVIENFRKYIMQCVRKHLIG